MKRAVEEGDAPSVDVKEGVGEEEGVAKDRVARGVSVPPPDRVMQAVEVALGARERVPVSLPEAVPAAVAVPLAVKEAGGEGVPVPGSALAVPTPPPAVAVMDCVPPNPPLVLPLGEWTTEGEAEVELDTVLLLLRLPPPERVNRPLTVSVAQLLTVELHDPAPVPLPVLLKEGLVLGVVLSVSVALPVLVRDSVPLAQGVKVVRLRVPEALALVLGLACVAVTVGVGAGAVAVEAAQPVGVALKVGGGSVSRADQLCVRDGVTERDWELQALLVAVAAEEALRCAGEGDCVTDIVRDARPEVEKEPEGVAEVERRGEGEMLALGVPESVALGVRVRA